MIKVISGLYSFLILAIHPANISTYYTLGPVLGVGDTPVMETDKVLVLVEYICVHAHVHGGEHIINTYDNFS